MKSEIIGTYTNNLPESDFRFFQEELHRTDRGTFFLSGHGGPMSPYAQQAGRFQTCYGQRNRTLTEEEADEWIDTHPQE